ncbi:hypothetical protein [Deminuibacter soli]|uniref:DUF1735 domain-containing protein n=1 Tax=Deminuibacter soli TaxID=2291815 RepID=A0A3E1NLV3_9BACT|nr:hypothetical protein [Deminuibacter soli]RFM28778.1 hypothetical protein DXN05_08340 [Deminuibacter soli]
MRLYLKHITYLQLAKRLLCALLPLWLMASCMKDTSGEFVPANDSSLNDSTWYETLSRTAAVFSVDSVLNASVSVYVDSVSAETGGTVTFADGSSVFCPAGFCNGNTTAKVKIELLVLHTKGDYVRFAKPTSTYDKLLESAVTFRIRLTQNGQPVSLASGAYLGVQFRSGVLGSPIHLYYGDTASIYPGNFTWAPYVQDDNSIQAFQELDAGTNTMVNGYRMMIRKTGWISCQYYSNYSSRIRLSVIVPPNYTNANTAVYAIVQSANTIVRLTPDVHSRTFFANISGGTQVTLVSISKRGGNLYWDSSQITVSSDGTPAYLHPVQTTKEQIVTMLNAL